MDATDVAPTGDQGTTDTPVIVPTSVIGDMEAHNGQADVALNPAFQRYVDNAINTNNVMLLSKMNDMIEMLFYRIREHSAQVMVGIGNRLDKIDAHLLINTGDMMEYQLPPDGTAMTSDHESADDGSLVNSSSGSGTLKIDSLVNVGS